MLAFIKFSARPNAEERLIIELNSIHTEIIKSKAIFNEMRCNPEYSFATLNEMGRDLNYIISLFNERIVELSLSPFFKKKRSLPKEIELLKINCL